MKIAAERYGGKGLSNMRLIPVLSTLAILACAIAPAGPVRIITTIAGRDFTFPDKALAAVSAPIGPISGIARDGADLYISDAGNNFVFKIDAGGTLSVVAGNGIAGVSGDGGPATSASVTPAGLAVDGNGNLYIAGGNGVRVVAKSGTISTIPGLSAAGSVAIDQAGNLYVVGADAESVQKRTPAGVITTVAGGCSPSCSGGTQARNNFLSVNAIAVDAGGNLFITTFGSPGTLFKVTPDGFLHTLAASLHYPQGLTADALGNVFVCEFYENDAMSNRVLKITPQGQISTVAGDGDPAIAGDNGPGASASLGPTGVVADDKDNLFIADSYNDRVRRLTSAGTIATIAGNGGFRFGGDSGPAASASLRTPAGLALDSQGDLLIADQGNNRVRKVTPQGAITTIAGNGVPAFRGDGGLATAASLKGPTGVAVDKAANIFVVDEGNNRIRKITPDGMISTVAGNGDSLFVSGFPSFNLAPGYTDPFFTGDGSPATAVPLSFPAGIAVNSVGELFISELFRIRKVGADGRISTVAGKGPGQCPPTPFAGFCGSYGGDGGPAIDANLNGPFGVAVDDLGDVIIADSGNGVIRKVTPDGQIATLVPTDSVVFDPHTPPIIRDLPFAVALDNLGAIYYSDEFHPDSNLFAITLPLASKVGVVLPSGGLTTIAGGGAEGFSGDGGDATNAALYSPSGLVIDAAGDLFIADTLNNRIREVLAAAPAVDVSPQKLSFSAASQGAPAMPQNLSVTSLAGLEFSVLIPEGVHWLRVDPVMGVAPRLIQVVADPATLAPGPYKTTITINAPNASPATISVPVSFAVGRGQPPTLSVDQTHLSFPYTRHGSKRSRIVTVSNSGGGTLNFTAAASASLGLSWLSVSPAGGAASPASPVGLTVTADPAGLAPGTYTGRVSLAAGAQIQNIPVTMTISTLDQAILLSQTGLSFMGVSQGGVLPPQSFGVLNIGTKIVNWKVSTTTLPPGGTWLQVTPASGSTDAAGAVPTVQVSVNAASLPQGKYYGLVRVDAPGAANTPQVLTVVVQVLAPGSPLGAVIQPAELLFTATPGESPGSQDLLLYNVAAAPKSFLASAAADSGLNLALLPNNATLDPQQPTRVVVQPFTSGLAAGVYRGVITLQFSDGNVLSANVKVIVAASGAKSGSGSAAQGYRVSQPHADAPCTAQQLVLYSNTLAQSFAVPAGYPVGLEVGVKDNCGIALTSGSVSATFSNGDQELQLQSLKNGLWNATWQTSSASQGAVTITLVAADQQRHLQGKTVVSTSLAATTDQPVFALEGVVSTAGEQGFVPVSPGSMITIYGKNLAGNKMPAPTVPLPLQLADASVFMAGELLPLYYVSNTQINAQIPFDIGANAPLQLVVLRGAAASLPVGVDVAPAQPAVFTGANSSQGAIFVLRGGRQFAVTPASPASPGDPIVMFCAGLGAVSPAVAGGAAAGSNPPSSTTNKVEVAIGGHNAQVSFAGLTPGLVGLYQINAVVPPGVPSGNAVPVMVTVAGQSSPQVVMAIK